MDRVKNDCPVIAPDKPSHGIRIATIVIFLVLQRTPARVNGVDRYSEVGQLTQLTSRANNSATLDLDGIRPGNGIQCDNMNRMVSNPS